MTDKVVSYLSKGFGLPVAEYYASGRRKIISVVSNDNFTLLLTFDNGEKRLYDMKPFLKDGTILELLKDRSVFFRVYLDAYGVVS